MEVLEIVLGDTLWKTSEKLDKLTKVPLRDVLKEKEFVGLYFGAQWSSHSTSFTKQLLEFYRQANQVQPNSLEIVYMSSDQSQEEFDAHYGTMPWLTMESETTEHVKRKNDMVTLFKAFRIPCIVILHGPTGKFISEHGRKDVVQCIENIASSSATTEKEQEASEKESTKEALTKEASKAVADTLQKWREAPSDKIQEGVKGIDYGGGSVSIILYFMNRPVLSLACLAALFFTPLITMISKNPTVILGVLYLIKRFLTPSGDQNLPAQPLALAVADALK